MKRKIAIFVFAVALLGLLYYFYGGGQVPAGQGSLVRLTAQNFSTLKSAFNSADGSVRMIVVLSPT